MPSDFSKLLAKTQENLSRLDEMESPNMNDGLNVGFEIGKNPLTPYLGQYPRMSDAAMSPNSNTAPTTTSSLPFPLENSTQELIAIYTALYNYRQKLGEAAKNPVIRNDPKKMLHLKRIRVKVNVLILKLKQIPPILDEITISPGGFNDDKDYTKHQEPENEHAYRQNES